LFANKSVVKEMYERVWMTEGVKRIKENKNNNH